MTYKTPEERDAAHKASVARWKAKTRMVSLDADVSAELSATSERLGEALGFKPTLSQTLRWLIKHAEVPS